ncbi:exported hypothetical protein [uncultured Microbacterium sp.]|uniref:Uncharacterized protein n=1 Tax=uncultured Microbacterium sp. TaxID=191216 RepID=A0A1Y5P2N5_9MICO|nr:exported hypothetical protein [uncultured Microbacterium sp.]
MKVASVSSTPSKSSASPLLGAGLAVPEQPARTIAAVVATPAMRPMRRSARDFTCHSFVGVWVMQMRRVAFPSQDGSALTDRMSRYGIAPTLVKGALPRRGHSSITTPVGARRVGGRAAP